MTKKEENDIIIGLLETIANMSKLKGENETLKKENEFLKNMILDKFGLIIEKLNGL